MDRGPGPYPHHAWWQIGWIMDYLLSEISLRTKGNISFPAGFITPKVGPHKSYGFEKGILFGRSVELLMKKDMVTLDNPHIDYVMAYDKERRELYVILLNNSAGTQRVRLRILPEILLENRYLQGQHLSLINVEGISENQLDMTEMAEIVFKDSDLKILKMKY